MIAMYQLKIDFGIGGKSLKRCYFLKRPLTTIGIAFAIVYDVPRDILDK